VVAGVNNAGGLKGEMRQKLTRAESQVDNLIEQDRQFIHLNSQALQIKLEGAL
jgi:hypothetical protein